MAKGTRTTNKEKNSQDQFSSTTTKSNRDGLREKELVTIGAEMYELMLNDPRMQVDYKTENEFKETDVPLIKAGYF